MRRVLKILLGVGLALCMVLAAATAFLHFTGLPKGNLVVPMGALDLSAATPERGRRFAAMLCWRCHQDADTGLLSGRALLRRFAKFGDVYAPNITHDKAHGIGNWTDVELAFVLRTGVHPRTQRALPPTMPRLARISDDDLYALIAYLRSDAAEVSGSTKSDTPSTVSLRSKLYARIWWQIQPFPASAIEGPSDLDPVALGRYLVNDLLQCQRCHSADFNLAQPLQPTDARGYLGGGARLADINGKALYSANLTPDVELGLGDWSFEDLQRALLEGFGRDGAVLRWPMPRFDPLHEFEVEAIYAYLREVPTLAHETPVGESYRAVPSVLDPGKHAFYQHRCMTCHAEDGGGQMSLAKVDEHFKTDAELMAFVRNPKGVDAAARMPAFEGVLAPEGDAVLAEYIRRRANKGPHAPPPDPRDEE